MGEGIEEDWNSPPARSYLVEKPLKGALAVVTHFCYTEIMPASNPRVNVVLEKPLFAALQRLAKKEAT